MFEIPENPNVSTQTIQTIEMKRLIKRGGGVWPGWAGQQMLVSGWGGLTECLPQRTSTRSEAGLGQRTSSRSEAKLGQTSTRSEAWPGQRTSTSPEARPMIPVDYYEHVRTMLMKCM